MYQAALELVAGKDGRGSAWEGEAGAAGSTTSKGKGKGKGHAVQTSVDELVRVSTRYKNEVPPLLQGDDQGVYKRLFMDAQNTSTANRRHRSVAVFRAWGFPLLLTTFLPVAHAHEW